MNLRQFFIPTLIVFSLTIVLSTGCGGKYATAPALQPAEKTTRPIRVAMMPLIDIREEDDRTAKMHQIPVMFFANYRKSKFDDAFKSKTDPWEMMLSQNVMMELKKQKAFEKIEFVTTSKAASRFPLVIRGNLKLAEQAGKAYGYGVSFLARYLWYLGFPKYSRYWSIEAEFIAIDTVEDKQIWRSKPIFWRTSSKPYWVYSDEFNFDPIKEGFNGLAKVAAATIQKELPTAAKGRQYYTKLEADHKQKMALLDAQGEAIEKLLPPELTISKPRTGAKMRGAETDVFWRAHSVNGLKVVKMMLNKEPFRLETVEQELQGSKAVDAPRTITESTIVPLKLGKNSILLHLEDHLNQTLNREIDVTRLPEPLYDGRRFAIVIGVSNYSDSSIPPGLPSEKMAQKLTDFMTDDYGGQMPQADVVSLIGADATKDEVIASIDDIVKNAVAKDTILIYYSGYSVAADRRGPAYLLTHDSKLADLENSAISLDELRDLLEQSLASNTVMITDAAFPLPGFTLSAQELLANLTRRLRNVAVIASTQRGNEMTKSGAASIVFSEVILRLLDEGLADLNGDEVITLRELVDKLGEDSEMLGMPTPGEAGRYDRELRLKMLK
jgi:hypothetical protein